ncbi:MAG: hypothetical protein ACRDMH_07080 [Solirubrobacterales bacterium]
MSRTAVADTQIDLFAWAEELNEEREQLERANAERSRRRGYLVFATDPSVHPDDPEYREVYATEAKTPAQAVRKIRPLAGSGRRLRAYLATGSYRHELAHAKWVG